MTNVNQSLIIMNHMFGVTVTQYLKFQFPRKCQLFTTHGTTLTQPLEGRRH